jgi:UDP-N-acetylmuramoylalanine--D-glutamate ligase
MAVRDPIDESRLHRLMPADALRVRGRHNAMNALAALALCRAVTPALAPLLHALREFHGGAHRTEWVSHVHGVDFVDDSKGTNVGATVAALTGIATPLILIAGGDGKGQDFSPMADALRRFAKAVITIGRDGPTIGNIASAQGVTVQAATSMEDAVRQAYSLATQLGGIPVLMSPACASFDMFKNYVARAQAFRDAVAILAEEQGIAC